MSLGLVSPILNRGVRSRWVSTLPASSKMLTIDAAGDVSYTDIPTAAWGSITGTLSSQTDLQNALNAKLSLSGGTMTGAILIPTGTAGSPSIAFTDDTDAGIYRQTNAINFSIGGTLRQQFQSDGTIVLSGTDPYLIIGTSLALSRDGNDILAQKRSTNAQTFRVYNTFTDASNYERGKIEWSSNVLRIGTEKAGTGSARALELQTDGTTRLTIGTTGDVTIATPVTLSIPSGTGNAFKMQTTDNSTNVVIALQDSSSNQLRASAFNFLNSAGTAQGQIAFWNSSTAANQYMNFNVAATEILRLTNATARLSVDLTLSTKNIITDTTTGTKIGTATTQKIGFYNATPVDQPDTIADPTGGATIDAEARTAINALIDRLQELGLIAT